MPRRRQRNNRKSKNTAFCIDAARIEIVSLAPIFKGKASTANTRLSARNSVIDIRIAYSEEGTYRPLHNKRRYYDDVFCEDDDDELVELCPFVDVFAFMLAFISSGEAIVAVGFSVRRRVPSKTAPISIPIP